MKRLSFIAKFKIEFLLTFNNYRKELGMSAKKNNW